MVKVCGSPVHVIPAFVKLGVTVIVAETGALELFTAVKIGGFPIPLAASPIDGLLFVQLLTLPTTLLMKSTIFVSSPLQMEIFCGTVTVGVGTMVMLKFCGIPEQDFGARVNTGVITTLPVWVLVKELGGVNPLIWSVPTVGEIPMEGLFICQL